MGLSDGRERGEGGGLILVETLKRGIKGDY